MKDILRTLKGGWWSHEHDFRLNEPHCRVIGCSAKRRLQENEPTLSILALALRQRDIEDLPMWLTAPRTSDGRTAVDALAAGDYDRARMLAYTNSFWERGARNRRRIERRKQELEDERRPRIVQEPAP